MTDDVVKLKWCGDDELIMAVSDGREIVIHMPDSARMKVYPRRLRPFGTHASAHH